ncbi:hypothetical protein [Cryptosporangium arvum]|uniref:hypothetical protein n=1 Tax=Cryptosporangium arvum TaxID=80871 RepID=UPI001FDFB7D9|nr:hypothetical protein [Cryptosporangium arvum]
MRNWTLPVALGVLQLFYWPRHLIPHPDEYVGVLAVVVVTVALGWRRRRPLIAFAGVIAGLTAGQLTTPAESLPVVQIFDMIALYSVVVREARRVWVITLGLLCVWQAAIATAVWDSARPVRGRDRVDGAELPAGGGRRRGAPPVAGRAAGGGRRVAAGAGRAPGGGCG